MKPKDRQELIENLDIMINVAATIEFTMPLKDSIPINVHGAYNNLQLAKECKHLEIYTHVSTAYANCNLPSGSYIEEKVYDLPVDAEDYMN